MDLKEKLIRIGSEHPDLRPSVRSVLSNLEKKGRERVGKRLFSPGAYRRLRKEIGKQRATPFLRFYRSLRRIYHGVEDPPEEGLRDRFRNLSRRLMRKIKGHDRKGLFKDLMKDGEKIFRRLDRQDDVTENNPRTRNFYKKIIRIYSNMLKELAKENGVYLKTKRLRRPGWMKFELTDQQEKKLERYKDIDEDLYEIEKKKNELRQKLNERIKDEVQKAGLEAQEEWILNQPVVTGKDEGDRMEARGKRRGENDDMWKLDYETSQNIDLREYGASATQIKLELDGDEYFVKDFDRDDEGHVYLKTHRPIDTKMWGTCQIKENEKWVYDKNGDVKPIEKWKEERQRELEAMDRLSRVIPEEEQLGEMRTYGTKAYGKGRRGDVSGHGLGKDRWVLKDKSPDFGPEDVKADPEIDLILYFDDNDSDQYDILDWDTQEKDGEEYVYITVDRDITSKQYGQYSIMEKENIVDKYKENQEIEYRALTDDSEKENAMTKIYPTIQIHDQTVVAEGRYKGMVLDDLINEAGRLIEGTAYDYDPDAGRPVRLQNIEDVDLKQPYISVNEDDELLLRLPSRNTFTDLRNRVRDVADAVTQVKYVEDTRQSSFTFKPEHFRSIRDACKSVAMSKAARRKIENYFKELRETAVGTDDAETAKYDADKMGGFKDEFDFHGKQKEALAWLGDGSGLIGADTGTGKCVSRGTLIETNRGTVPIERLNPGVHEPDSHQRVEEDWKVYVDGSYLPVKNFYYGGVKPVNRITTKKGYSVEGSEIHPLLVADEEGLNYRKTDDIEEGDYVAIHRDRKEGGFTDSEPEMEFPDFEEMHHHTEHHDLPEKMTPELAKLFGYILAEGWTNHGSEFTISQSPDENPKMHQEIGDLLETYLKKADPSTEEEKDRRVSSRYVRAYLEENGIGRSTSAEKSVPECILRGSRDIIGSFLKVMFSCEGHVSERGCCEFYSASEEMTRQIQTLLLKFGVVSSLREKEVEGEKYFSLFVSGKDALLFKKKIGFIRDDQKRAFEEGSIGGNENHDVIPHSLASSLLRPIKNDLEKSVDVGLSNKRSGVKTSVRTTISNVIHQERGLTYEKAEEIINTYDEIVDNDNYRPHVIDRLRELTEREIFFDRVQSVESDEKEIMDIEVDHPSHTFVGNGFYNHNTLVAMGYIKNLMNKGVLEDESDKVLLVVPSSLTGNLEGEVMSFMEDPDDLLKHVETMTYGEMSRLGDVPRDAGIVQVREEAEEIAYIQQYEAVIFDEASYLKDKNSKRSVHAQVEHPRKVLMTASPMEKDPDELFNLVATAEDIDLSSGDGLERRRNFHDNYTEQIGSMVVGVTEDATQRENLVDWMHQHMFHIDKTEMKEVDLPSLNKEPMSVSMPEQVEEEYRKISSEISDTLRRMTSLYRDNDEDAYSPKIRGAMVHLKDYFVKLTRLANEPEEVIDGMTVEDNPKLNRSLDLIKEDVQNSTRSLLWTDDPSLAEKAARFLSEKLPSTKHAFGTSDEIGVYKNGRKIESYTQRVYEDPETGEKKDPNEWRQHVTDTYISPPEEDVVSFSLTQSYSKGFNLQAFSKVIHLDRDNWNSQKMEQRTARSWRQGQDEQVNSFTLDMTYSEPKDERDRTLDEVRRYLQETEEELIEEFIRQTQKEMPGKAWFGMKKEPAEMYDVSNDLLELAASPYLENFSEVKAKEYLESRT